MFLGDPANIYIQAYAGEATAMSNLEPIFKAIALSYDYDSLSWLVSALTVYSVLYLI